MATISIRPASLTYKIVRGDDFADVITIKEGDPPEPADLTGRTYTAQVRRTPNGDVIAEMTIDDSNLDEGQVGIALPDATTADMSGSYVWDFQQDSAGVVRTLLKGAFVVDPDVTRDE